MNITSKNLPQGQVEFTIEVPVIDVEKHLPKAAAQLASQVKVDGFRPGKAPYELMKQRFGEMAIYQEALDSIIRDTLFKALEQEKIEVVGQPEINLDKLAPGNPIVYRAVFTLLPKVTIKNYKNFNIKPKSVAVDDEKINKTLEQLQKMRAKESLIDAELSTGNKAVIDFTILVDKVPIDGAQQQNYPVYLGENLFLPEFEKELIGLKAGSEKEFPLSFPATYFQKNLAGKKAEAKVKVKEVYKIEKPELNDDFAKTLGGYKDMIDLKEQIKQNIIDEEKFENEQKTEMEILDAVIKESEFTDLPKLLIEGELEKMLHELQYNLSRQGMIFEDYLVQLKTTIEDLKKSFTPQAEKRIKTSLILREVGKLENISITTEELHKEIDQLVKSAVSSKTGIDYKSDSYQRYLENLLVNRKVIEKLKEYNIEK